MLMYTIRRLLMLIPILLGVTFLTFSISKVTPGDPVALMLGNYATPERVAELREELGYNDPFFTQFGRYVWNAAQGDLGYSVRGKTPVLEEILARFPSTLQLTVSAMFLAIVFGVGAGVMAALSKSKAIDGSIMVVALAGLSLPQFWLAIILILIFGVNLHWVSVVGGAGLKNLILPSITLALAPAATLARMTRSSILEVIREDYVRTARAKGLNWRAVTQIHVLKNALIPVVTIIGLTSASLLGGAVFIENVFARPGLGRFAVNAITARDYPQVQGVVLFTATIFVLLNLAVDLIYGWLDPRIRFD
jgi:peptide/nickel transport system permease protein